MDDADASASNEIQSLTLNTNILDLSLGGGSVNLSSYLSPWSSSGSNLFFNLGNVGIGDATPSAKLNIDAGPSGAGLSVLTSLGNAGRFSSDSGTALVAASTGSGKIAQFLKNGNEVVMIGNQGGLGIGTTFASTKLDVRESSSSANVVNIQRKVGGLEFADMLQIEANFDAADDSEFIECERGTDIEFRVNGDGSVTADGTFSGPADFTEMIRVSEEIDAVEPGDVMVIDIHNPRAVICSDQSHSTLVAGVYSTKPGYLGSENDWDQVSRLLTLDKSSIEGEETAMKPVELGKMINEIPLAIVGIVPCKVTAYNGAIKPGDLLVTSPVRGHAMRAEQPKVGTIVGKALGSLASGQGVIKILVTLQ